VVACEAVPKKCGPPTDSCLFTELRASVRAEIAPCQVRCGEFAIFFASGCAADVRTELLQGRGGNSELEACVRTAILGRRESTAKHEKNSGLWSGSVGPAPIP
jgi:hypothetical protein